MKPLKKKDVSIRGDKENGCLKGEKMTEELREKDRRPKS